jgi:hypothetical protein
MSLFERIKSVFSGKESPAPHSDAAAKVANPKSSSGDDEAPDLLSGKGIPAFFYRKWKDPAFIKQMRALAAQMQREGVDLKSMSAVKAWIEKNKEAIESGKIDVQPEAGAKVAPYIKSSPDISRNDPCPCGSGKKYKKCCALKAAKA